MSAQSTLTPPSTRTLQQLVQRWDRRLRLQQLVRWTALSLVPGLVMGIGLAVAARVGPLMLPRQIVVYAALGALGGWLMMSAAVLLYPRSVLRAAQRFDVAFGLKERVSTAFELLNGQIRTTPALQAQQIDDAISHAQAVRPADHMPITARWQEWAAVFVLIAALATLLIWPNTYTDEVVADTQQDEAIDEAADDLRDVTEDLAADPTLTDEQRDELLEELDSAIETLEEPNLTQEEAAATLSDVQTALQNQANALAQELAAQRQALASAGAALSGALPNAPSDAPNGDAAPDLNDLLRQFEEALNNATPEEQAALAQSLNEAADALESTQPNAAQALNDAAQSLQQGDTDSAQQSLGEASQSLQNTPQAQQGLQDAQQALQSGANTAAQAQQNLQPNGQTAQPIVATVQPGQIAPQGTPAFALADPNASQDPNQNGPNSASPSEGSDGGEGGQSPMIGGAAGNPVAMPGGGNTGAGDEEAPKNENGFAANGDPISTNNDPDGEGETAFDSVFAPQRIGGESDGGLFLDSSDGDSPVVEGDFSENPAGAVTVPYNEVFSDYSEAANDALESDYIPLGMQDIIRDYFTAIDPNGN